MSLATRLLLPASRTAVLSPALLAHRRFFCALPTPPTPPPPPPADTLFSKAKRLFTWVRTTAKEKGKPFIAWYVALYVGGLIGSYGAVKIYGKVEPEIVKKWAKKLGAERVVNIEEMDLSKKNCEYLAALLLNEVVDTPRLILAVLTIDRVILLGRRVLRKGVA